MSEALNILVAEDELVVQAVTSMVLEQHGFNVTRASSTEEALEIVERRDFDAVLLDIDIGDKGGGYRVARRVRALRPATWIIYTSGGAMEAFERERVPDTAFVPKPYSPDRVCEMIDQRLCA